MAADAASHPEIASAALAHLRASEGFRALEPARRAELDDAMAKVQGFLVPPSSPYRPYAEQLAPDLRAALGRRAQTAPQSPAAPAPASAGAAQPAPAPSVTGRVGDVARATLNAIDFPTFVASLIQGTFQAIVDASIQQMEAYAELLRNVAGTVDRFMHDNIDEGTAKDYLADTYPGTFQRDAGQGAPQLVVNRQTEGVPSFLEDLGFSSTDDIDGASVDEVIVPATRRSLAEQRQQTLATMVLMGINRVVVDDGEIQAKLIFHIDASETTELKFDNKKTTKGNMSGTAGRNQFTANGVMVNTTNLNAQSDINVRADLTGQVTVRFRSEVFPLERFADSAAVQFINSNAKVPAPAAPPANGAQAAVPAPPTPSPPPAAAQALAADAWAPKQASG